MLTLWENYLTEISVKLLIDSILAFHLSVLRFPAVNSMELSLLESHLPSFTKILWESSNSPLLSLQRALLSCPWDSPGTSQTTSKEPWKTGGRKGKSHIKLFSVSTEAPLTRLALQDWTFSTPQCSSLQSNFFQITPKLPHPNHSTILFTFEGSIKFLEIYLEIFASQCIF